MATATTGGTYTVYSSRFTLTGMTGTFAAAVVTANAGVTSTDPPAAIDALAGDTAATTAAADGEFAVSYTAQTGLTKYAAMQPVPPTAITKTNTAPLNPTSSVVLASTFLPIPSEVTTLTQSQTFSVSSRANTVSFLVKRPRHY